MSSKSKEAIAAARDYLGRDAHGLKLLDDVAREMTELRKRGNADRERAELATQSAKRNNDLLQKSETEVLQLKKELEQLRALLKQRDKEIYSNQHAIEQLQHQIGQLQSDLTESDLMPDGPTPANLRPSKFPEKLLLISEFTTAFNEMRKQLTTCPVPSGKRESREIYYYRLEDIVQSYSPSEMILLGRFVACCAMFNFPCFIEATTTFYDTLWKLEKNREVKSRSKFIRWFRHNMREDITSRLCLPKH